MQIHEALATYKDLYLFEYEGNKLIFRPLSWQEYKNFHYLFATYPALRNELEEIIWGIAVVEHNFPAGVEYLEAGVASTVAQLIIYFSGCSFTSERSLSRANNQLEEAKSETKSVESQIKLAILEAFPSYKLEDLENLSWSKIIELLAFSEHLLKKTFEFNIKKKENTDSSDKVFEMLNDYSANKGAGFLPVEEDDEIRK